MVESNIRFSRADQLTMHLKERCLKLNAGEKFLSVRQIMDEFNVSQITVKQAVERLCESGVLEAQDRRGYFVRRTPRYRKIVCLMPEGGSTIREEFPKLLEHECAGTVFEPSIIDMKSNAEGVTRLAEIRADAVFFIPFSHEPVTSELLNRMMALPIPAIIIYATVRIDGCRYVDTDNEFCGVLAATHLLMNGHRKLAVMISEPDLPVVRERVNGFLKCAEAYHLDVEVLNPQIRVGEHSPTKSREFFKAYLKDNPDLGFTGLFVISEDPAREIIRAAEESGLSVPEDFSLISLGHRMLPGGTDVTTINSRRDQVVHHAVRLIKEYFEQPDNAPMHHLIIPEIHFGQTVKNNHATRL